jgi:hypothetical protein
LSLDTLKKIPIVDTQEHFGLYQNVEFKPLADGKWELAGYNKREKGIYEIETVNLFLTEEPPIQGFLEVTAFPRDCIQFAPHVNEYLATGVPSIS